jgi:hypothetical protein
MPLGPEGAAEAVARERAMAAFEPQPELAGLELGLPATVKLAELRARRPGRPPGARNKRAEDVAREVIERLGDPLVMLASLAMTPTDELVAAGLKLTEALAEKRLAAIAVLPFLHQRKAIEVDVKGRQVVHLTIDVGVGAADVVELNSVEVQQVSEGADGPV